MPETTARGWRTQSQLQVLSQNTASDAERCSFAVIGDAEPGRFFWNRLLFGERGVFWAQLRGVARESIDLIMQLGDMVSEGRPAHYDEFQKGLDSHCPDVPYLTVLGNHDREDPHSHSNSTQYRSRFGEPNYWFDRGPARFVVLDTSVDGLKESQMRWLDKALDTDKVKIVFMHKPPAGLARWTAGSLGGFKKRSRSLMRLLSKRGVDRVYMGHIHGFGRVKVDGVTYVLSGGGGSPLYPWLVEHRFYHYMVVDVGPDGIKETVQKLNGERVPAQTLERRPETPWPARLRLQYLNAATLLAIAAIRIPH